MEDINKAFSEVYDIINHMEENLYNKIPKKFIKLLENNRDMQYKFNIDYSKSINEQELLHETKTILSLIYRDYLCSKEEQAKLLNEEKKELEEAERNLREQYNQDNLFKNKTIQEEKSIQMVEYKKESFFKRILEKLKKFLKRG